MAIAPMFVADMATLKANLRLSGVPSTSTDTLKLIEQAVIKARAKIYRRLGRLRVNQLTSTVYVENGITDDQILRGMANTLEIDLVRLELMILLPMAFMDASGDLDKRWNEEAPFREKPVNSMKNQILAMENRIEEEFQMLGLEEEMVDETSINTFDGSRLTAAPRPGDSLRNSFGRSTQAD